MLRRKMTICAFRLLNVHILPSAAGISRLFHVQNMQKTHGSHVPKPLTKSIGVGYLSIIGGRETSQAKMK
jgi:hypothetical protein